ncbi:MAG: hypothetical protein JNL05_12885, partial [Flavobacteriales bacterium]|nr:hypothetical protein [Flavobacteriales bacterium]
MLVTKDSVHALAGRRTAAAGDAVPHFTSTGPVDHLMVGTGVKFDEMLAGLERDQVRHIMCHSRWSMHQLIEHLARRIGKAKLYFTTWTVTEAPMRTLLRLHNQGVITAMHAVLDDRVEKQNANGAQLALANIASIAFTGIHAKCFVLIGENESYTVVTTANLTRNKRIELYVVDTHAHVANG